MLLWGSEAIYRLSRLQYLLLVCCLYSGLAIGHPDLDLQIEKLSEQLQQQADNIELLIQRGDLHRRHEDYVAADKDFNAARLLQPDYALLDFYQGRLNLETGDAAAAEHLLTAYLQTHPDHAHAWVLLAEAKLDRGFPALAAADFAQAITHSDSPTPSLFLQQALALVAAGTTHWPAAGEALDAGLVQFPGDMSLLGLATDIALAVGNNNKAKEYLAVLPEPLRRLPQWSSRLELQHCLTDQEIQGTIAEECQQSAIRLLSDQARPAAGDRP